MKLILLMVLVGVTLSLFESGSPVFKLTADNFKSEVLQSDRPWLVEFYGNYDCIQLHGADIASDQPQSLKRQHKF